MGEGTTQPLVLLFITARARRTENALALVPTGGRGETQPLIPIFLHARAQDLGQKMRFGSSRGVGGKKHNKNEAWHAYNEAWHGSRLFVKERLHFL